MKRRKMNFNFMSEHSFEIKSCNEKLGQVLIVKYTI